MTQRTHEEPCEQSVGGCGRASRRTVLAAVGTAAVAGAAAACRPYGGPGEEDGGATGAETGAEGEAAGDWSVPTGDVPVGGGRVYEDEGVVITQPEEGTYAAFGAACTHQGCTVADVSDGTINCPCHGSRFDPADGSVAGGPAQDPLPRIPIEVEGDAIRPA